MNLSPFLRPLAIAASIIGLVQSLIYSVLTLLGILLICTWTLEYPVSTLVGSINLIYFEGESPTSSPLIIFGHAFNGFVWTYFFLSFVWMVLCLSMLWAFMRHKYAYAKNSVMSWCVWTGLISILDIIMMCLFGADFHNITHDEDALYEHVSAVGVMMTIAAKGYGLVVANITFTIILYLIVIKMDSSVSDTVPIREEPYINAYGTPPWLTPGGGERFGREMSNPGYDERASYNRGRSGNYATPANDVQPKLGGLPRGPFIPAPDYSPPGTLQQYPKSVLKSRSQY